MLPKVNLFDSYVAQIREHLKDDSCMVRALNEFSFAEHVQFAVDYSEVFAFCFVMTNRGLTYTEHENVGRQIALNEAIANHIFFGSNPVLLLPAYRAELSTLQRGIRNFSVAGIAELTEYLSGIQSRNSELLTWLAEIDSRLANSSGPNMLRTLAEVYDRAPGLLLLLDDFEPASRLKRIEAPGILMSTNELKWSNKAHVSSDTRDWWMDKLLSARPRASASSNLIDATAVSQLQALNRSINAEQPIVLVSRSEVMRRILAENTEIAQCEKVYIVHPRVIGTYIVGDGTGKSGDTILEDRYWLGKEIVADFGRNISASGAPLQATLRRRVRNVLRLWNEIDDVSIARSAWGRPSLHDQDLRTGSIVESIGSLLAKQADVRNKLEQRTAEIERTIRLENVDIATINVVQSDTLPYQEIDVRTREASRKDTEAPVLVIRASAEAMPYSMQIYDSQFARWIGQEPDSVKALRRFVRSNPTESSEYERLLGLGYLLASISVWDIALTYFVIAIDLPRTVVPPHEAFYFRAVARRNSLGEMSSDTLKLCASDIMQANNIKRQRRGAEYWDPRYQNELGILLALHKSKGESPEWADAWEQDPLTIWDDALTHISDDTILVAQVLNNRTYYCALNVDRVGREGLEPELNRLTRFFDSATHNALTDGILHTQIVARYLLSEQTRDDAIEALTSLKALQARGSIWPSLRRVIEVDIERYRSVSKV